MFFSKTLVLSLGAIGASGGPVEIFRAEYRSAGVGNVDLASRSFDPAPLDPSPTLRQRATPFWTQVGHGVFWVGIGALAQGSAWLDMVESCEEYSENKKISTGASCVFSALTNVFKTGIYATGSFHAAITIKNVIFPPNNGGGSKRDLAENAEWTVLWDSMSEDQKLDFQSLWKQSGGLHLHRLDNGIDDISNSVTMYLSHDEDAGTPHYRHITNGTHGMIHTLSDQDFSFLGLAKRGDKFKFSKTIHGIKLSYRRPCIYEQLKETNKVDGDLISAVTNMVSYMDAHPHKAWDFEWADNKSKNEIMYGTLTVETKPFGMNYVSPDFVPQQSVCERT
jgi:hypothetical protein